MRIHSAVAAWSIVMIATVFAALACFLPDNEFQRWQLLRGTIHEHTRWLYERIRYDPTPIDVAILGPSRTNQGVDGPRLSDDLRARGFDITVANLSLAESGRNINWVVAEQLFKYKAPKLLIIGVIEKPGRFGHPTFKFTAPAMEILNPGYQPDLNYFSDIIYLPYRQIYLFGARLFPSLYGLDEDFVPRKYLGPRATATGSFRMPDGHFKEGERSANISDLDRGARDLARSSHKPLLPARYADVEFGDERIYIRRIVALASQHHTRVAFLFLPYYSGPTRIQEQAFYDRYGPVWNAGYLASRPELFADTGHLTRSGAFGLTDWLSDRVATYLKPGPNNS